MLNKTILLGNIGRTPKVGVDQNKREIATFFLATNTSWKACPREGGEPEWQEHTDWHRIIVFRESTVRWIKDALQQGDTVYVEGKLTYHQWTDKYNQFRLTPSIVIAGNEGKVQYLRSSKIPQKSWTQDTEDQEDFQVQNMEEDLSQGLVKAMERA